MPADDNASSLPPTERERMLSGDFYDSRAPELLGLARRARGLLARFNEGRPDDSKETRALLEALLGHVGPGVWVEPPLFCDYGAHICIGAQTFANVNCVLLDSAEIHIGAFVLLGPGVQLLTAHHPLRASERIPQDGRAETGHAPYRTQAHPIRVEDRVWLGARVTVLPGVTVGEGATVAAGSVVTEDVPAGVLAAGQPCRVVRKL